MNSALCGLPADVWEHHIFPHLTDPEDLKHAARVCKAWHQVFKKESIQIPWLRAIGRQVQGAEGDPRTQLVEGIRTLRERVQTDLTQAQAQVAELRRERDELQQQVAQGDEQGEALQAGENGQEAGRCTDCCNVCCNDFCAPCWEGTTECCGSTLTCCATGAGFAVATAVTGISAVGAYSIWIIGTAAADALYLSTCCYCCECCYPTCEVCHYLHCEVPSNIADKLTTLWDTMTYCL